MNKKQIENLIYDYHWMRREVDRLQRIIWGSSIPERSWGVAQYGIEATLPHGSSGKSKAELEAMDLREERAYRRLQLFEAKVYAVEMISDNFYNQGMGFDKKDENYFLVVLDCMMDGMSYRAIAAHLGMSRNRVREIKDNMLSQICQKCHFVHDLFNEKSVV